MPFANYMFEFCGQRTSRQYGKTTRGWNDWFATFERVYPLKLRLNRTKSFFVYFGL